MNSIWDQYDYKVLREMKSDYYCNIRFIIGTTIKLNVTINSKNEHFALNVII
jgi:hypothetical protein